MRITFYVDNHLACTIDYLLWQRLVSSWSRGYDTHPDSNHVIHWTHYFLWWPMWLLSSKYMRTCSLIEGVNVTAISVLGSLAVMMLAQIVRDWSLIPRCGTGFLRIMSLIRPTLRTHLSLLNETYQNLLLTQLRRTQQKWTQFSWWWWNTCN